MSLEQIDKTLTQAISFDPDDDRAVVAKITTTDIDRSGDVVLPQGAELSDFHKNPVVFFNHDAGKLPIGVAATPLERRRDGIVAKMHFATRPPSHPESMEWAPDTLLHLVKIGVLRAFSIGFRVLNARRPTSKDVKAFGSGARQVIDRWKLLEFSLVGIPDNQDALAMAVSKGIVSKDSWAYQHLQLPVEHDRAIVVPFSRPAPLVVG